MANYCYVVDTRTRMMQKKSIVGILIIIGAVILFFLYRSDSGKSDIFSIELPDGSKELIKEWTNASDGKQYLFMPSYAEIEDSEDNILLQFDDALTIFVTTSTGSMKDIYDNKNHKEVCQIKMISDDGQTVQSSTDLTICGHGSSSWEQGKKSFKLSFNNDVSIIAGTKGKEWILTSNYFDNTYLKNATVLETAKKMTGCIASEYCFVNLYLNGEYNGLYLLTQAPKEIMNNYHEPEDYILMVSENKKVSQNTDNSYELNSDFYIRVCNRNAFDETTSIKAVEYVNNADNTIAESEGNNIEQFDVESWAVHYLIDEIFENFDAGIKSFYLYSLNGDNGGKVYAGPIWDYDISMGNSNRVIRNPRIIYANQFERSNSVKILWYGYLCQNEEFKKIYIDKYKNEIRDIVLDISDYIIELERSISGSSALDRIRWNKEANNAKELQNWLNNRIDFLDSIWLDGDEYACVTIKTNDSHEYERFWVEKGANYSTEPFLAQLVSDGEFDFICENSLEPFDIDSYAESDIVINKISKASTNTIARILNNNIELLSVIIMFGLLGALAIVMLLFNHSFIRAKKKRDCADGKMSS